jgi:hypothetical protein
MNGGNGSVVGNGSNGGGGSSGSIAGGFWVGTNGVSGSTGPQGNGGGGGGGGGGQGGTIAMMAAEWCGAVAPRLCRNWRHGRNAGGGSLVPSYLTQQA